MVVPGFPACASAPQHETPQASCLSRPCPRGVAAATREPVPPARTAAATERPQVRASTVDSRQSTVPSRSAKVAGDDYADAPPSANDAQDSLPDAGEALPAAIEPFDLAVDGFEPAVVVPPDGSSASPARLVVVLHGNFDRPEWECATWRAAAREDWLLCPRGVPREDADPALDRWTYRTAHDVAEETAAAVEALRAARPGEVREDGAVLIGFSLGAHMAWRVVESRRAPVFELVVFGEGGYFVEADSARKAVDRGVRKVLFLCGELTRCTASIEQAERRWRSGGAAVERIVMPGTAHAYAADFEPFARRVLEWLLAE